MPHTIVYAIVSIALGPLVGGDLLVALAADQHDLVADLDGASPTSTISWSIVTVPAIGHRRPPISTSPPRCDSSRGTPSA